MDITTLFQLSHMNILAINIETDVNVVVAVACFIYSILTLYFLVRGNLFVFERRNEKKHFESTLKEKDLLNRMVVLLMCKLLQSDEKDMYANKLAFVVNYIRTSFDKEADIDYLVHHYVLKYTSSQSLTLEMKIFTHIRNIRRTLFNPKGWLRDLKRKQDYSVYGGMLNLYEYFGLPDDDVKELAFSLTDYLSEERKKYLSYLLFQLAYMDGNINKREETDLKRICVNQFLTKEEFYTLKDSFESKSEDKWFYENLRKKDPELYSDPEVVLNIFPKSTENDKETNTKFIIKNDKRSVSFLLLFIQMVISNIVLAITAPTRGTVSCTIMMVIIFFIITYYNGCNISDKYYTAFTRKDYNYLVKEIFYSDILYLFSLIFIFFA